MRIHQNIDLKPFNTFKVSAIAKYFVHIEAADELAQLKENKELAGLPIRVLGGGSNILLKSDYPGVIVKIDIKGIEQVSETDTHVEIKAGAGEDWADLIKYALTNNLGGIENLTLIPGSVGATPVQNIGAYGVEAKDTIIKVDVFNTETNSFETLTNEQCQFGYRNSIFKRPEGKKFIITYVTFRLNKAPHALNLNYANIPLELEKAFGKKDYTIQEVSEVVAEIRRTKLPDPNEIGTAGSFFKNPVVSVEQASKILADYPEAPNFPDQGAVKIPAGWLLEQCGWKGKTFGEPPRYGVHKNHALVPVNYQDGTGDEIWQLALDMQASVKEKFGIELEPEVNII